MCVAKHLIKRFTRFSFICYLYTGGPAVLADAPLLRMAEQAGQLLRYFPAGTVQSGLLLRLQSPDSPPQQEKVLKKLKEMSFLSPVRSSDFSNEFDRRE